MPLFVSRLDQLRAETRPMAQISSRLRDSRPLRLTPRHSSECLSEPAHPASELGLPRAQTEVEPRRLTALWPSQQFGQGSPARFDGPGRFAPTRRVPRCLVERSASLQPRDSEKASRHCSIGPDSSARVRSNSRLHAGQQPLNHHLGDGSGDNGILPQVPFAGTRFA